MRHTRRVVVESEEDLGPRVNRDKRKVIECAKKRSPYLTMSGGQEGKQRGKEPRSRPPRAFIELATIVEAPEISIVVNDFAWFIQS